MKTLEEVYRSAAQLPADEQLQLARRLLAAVEPDVLQKVEDAWDLEIQKRIKRFDSGQISTRSAEEVFAKIDQQLGR